MIVSEQICKWKCDRCGKNVDAYVSDANNLLHKFHTIAHIITQCPYCDYILIVKAEQK
jgi:DNA-directed RNA polymerase subunit RPC12/RpoP